MKESSVEEEQMGERAMLGMRESQTTQEVSDKNFSYSLRSFISSRSSANSGFRKLKQLI